MRNHPKGCCFNTDYKMSNFRSLFFYDYFRGLGRIRSLTKFTPNHSPFLSLLLQVQFEVLKMLLDADCTHATVPLLLPFNAPKSASKPDTTRVAHNQLSFDERKPGRHAISLMRCREDKFQTSKTVCFEGNTAAPPPNPLS